jgi:hypothetical protein
MAKGAEGREGFGGTWVTRRDTEEKWRDTSDVGGIQRSDGRTLKSFDSSFS